MSYEDFPDDEDAEHVEPIEGEQIFPRFAAYADKPGEEPYFHFCIIEPKNFVIKSLGDVTRVYQEIVACGQENPGMVPVVHIEDLRG